VLVKKADFDVPGDGLVRVDLTVGADRGVGDGTWSVYRKGIRLR
jgi:hypothetical protein